MTDDATDGAGMRFDHVTTAGRATGFRRCAGGACGVRRFRRMPGVGPFPGLGPVRGGF